MQTTLILVTFHLVWYRLKHTGQDFRYFLIFSHLQNLKMLYLGFNHIITIPRDNIDGLKQLRELKVYSNRFTSMPNISYLSALKRVDLSENHISCVPTGTIDGLLNLTFLTKLPMWMTCHTCRCVTFILSTTIWKFYQTYMLKSWRDYTFTATPLFVTGPCVGYECGPGTKPHRKLTTLCVRSHRNWSGWKSRKSIQTFWNTILVCWMCFNNEHLGHHCIQYWFHDTESNVCILYIRIRLTRSQYWFRFGAEQVIIHYINQCWLSLLTLICLMSRQWITHGESNYTIGISSKRLVIQSFDVFFDVCLNQRLSKQSRHWWFAMTSRSLWHHCNNNFNDFSLMLQKILEAVKL